MRELGLGIKHSTLTSYLDNEFPQSLSGKILLDVENNGEAYYVHPKDKKGYYLGKPSDAFNVMRELGLGISNKDLETIKKKDEINDKPDDLNINEFNNIELDETRNISINLIENANWNIHIKACETSKYFPDDCLYFNVYRNNEEMEVETYRQDPNTGNFEKYYTEYSARFDEFSTPYIENNIRKYKKDVYLSMYRHWYEYPNLEVNFNSESFYVPININKTPIDGAIYRAEEYSDSYRTDAIFKIKIQSKNNSENKCSVKGFTNYKGKFYYNSSSDNFNKVNHFKCFSNEKNAISDGYKKSFDN
jgi:hypothetical protein